MMKLESAIGISSRPMKLSVGEGDDSCDESGDCGGPCAGVASGSSISSTSGMSSAWTGGFGLPEFSCCFSRSLKFTTAVPAASTRLVV